MSSVSYLTQEEFITMIHSHLDWVYTQNYTITNSAFIKTTFSCFDISRRTIWNLRIFAVSIRLELVSAFGSRGFVAIMASKVMVKIPVAPFGQVRRGGVCTITPFVLEEKIAAYLLRICNKDFFLFCNYLLFLNIFWNNVFRFFFNYYFDFIRCCVEIDWFDRKMHVILTTLVRETTQQRSGEVHFFLFREIKCMYAIQGDAAPISDSKVKFSINMY